jgi:hypothetical protein
MRMRFLVIGAFALIVGSSWFCSAQITVKNPNHLYFPEDRAQVIFSTACRVVAKQLRVRKGSKVDFPLVVVMGEQYDRYTADLTTHVFTIYLNHWDAAQFAASSMGLAIQLSIPQEQKVKVVAEVLRRSGQVLTVSVDTLRHKDGSIPTAAAIPGQR